MSGTIILNFTNINSFKPYYKLMRKTLILILQMYLRPRKVKITCLCSCAAHECQSWDLNLSLAPELMLQTCQTCLL